MRYELLVEQLLENCRLYRQPVREDGRGKLIALEAKRQVPFEIKRIYYLFASKDEAPRGFHAHKALRQWFICMSGSCELIIDDGRARREVRLATPELALFVGPMVWREIRKPSPDCVLMVLASDYFDEDDYIRDYDEFIAALGRGSEGGAE